MFLIHALHRRALAALATLAISCAAPQAFAAVALINDGYTGTGTGHSSADYAGFIFSISAPISVTSLGMWAGTDNAVAEQHQLGMFSFASHSQVAGTTISGSGDFFNADNYIFASLASPVVLGAGQYFVGALYGVSSPDNFLVVPDAATPDGVQLFDPAISFSTTGVYPGTTPPDGFFFNGKQFYGANFTFDVSAVPEPEIYAMLTLGLGFLGWQARRRSGMSNRAA